VVLSKFDIVLSSAAGVLVFIVLLVLVRKGLPDLPHEVRKLVGSEIWILLSDRFPLLAEEQEISSEWLSGRDEQ
jgi:hypothetical protein